MSTDLQTSAQPLWFIDNLAYVHVDGEKCGGAYSLSEIWGAHGNMPPLHVHHRDDEAFYLLEGELRLFLGDRQIALGAGQAALAPREVPHTYRVESDRARWTRARGDERGAWLDRTLGRFWESRFDALAELLVSRDSEGR